MYRELRAPSLLTFCQVYFSSLNPMLNFDLPFFQRLWYTYAAWAPFCTALTVPGKQPTRAGCQGFALVPACRAGRDQLRGAAPSWSRVPA